MENDQRKVIYQQRLALLQSQDIATSVTELREEVMESVFHRYIPKDSMAEAWDIPGLERILQQDFHLSLPLHEWLEKDDSLQEETLKTKIHQALVEKYATKEGAIGVEALREAEKNIMLRILDTQWKDHLSAMDLMRRGIQLRGYAQKNPTQEFKRESFNIFTAFF